MTGVIRIYRKLRGLRPLELRDIRFAIAVVAALGLTSCLSENNDNQNSGLSGQEISQCLALTKGNYTGKLLFEIQNPNDINDFADTLDISWSVTADTTVVINQFPQTAFLENIKDKKLKEAIQEAAPAPLKAYMGFYKASPVGFLLYPYTIDYDIQYEDGPHKASVVFWANTYSYGQYDASNNIFEMQFIIAALYLDDNARTNYLSTIATEVVSLPIVVTSANFKK